jgi:hypothetical protein
LLFHTFTTFSEADNHYESVYILLKDSRVDPSAKDNEAIKLASYNGHKKVVEILLMDSRVDPSAQDNWALKWVFKNGHQDVFNMLNDVLYT